MHVAAISVWQIESHRCNGDHGGHRCAAGGIPQDSGFATLAQRADSGVRGSQIYTDNGCNR